ncbi:HNH endonuclease domain-containing protein [Spirosoma linguale]|uniref:HNH nuclease domain-containing protein n=1 Tax=Spirosoma linguale (strain ATCC 33905 / DSM 74 / LMG 10896 / Claus 1) TaxID=504472 RepID=D2QIV9_SPILD|nr:conserved hypothetical protein [Spirosoma linguale DSM 74]
MELPNSTHIDISKLTGIFTNTTNSYKFYWFLAILDSIKDNDQKIISLNDMALRMVANVWYPLDYFKLSFGTDDSFIKISQLVSNRIIIDNSTNSAPLFDQLQSKLSNNDLTEVYRTVNKIVRYVPYRFVRPFINELLTVSKDSQVNLNIKEICNSIFHTSPNKVMYRFIDNSIELSDVWKDYLKTHQGILRGFIYWHLLQFLQKNNPNVIGLPDKLFKRSTREPKRGNEFWKPYIEINPDLKCVYSRQRINSQNMSLDHFLPWSYVVHDLLWNIIPTTKSVNSAKSNSLPSIDLYFEDFAQLQYDGFHFHVLKGNEKLLEDYSVLFGQNIHSIQEQPFALFRKRLEQTILPQLQMAQNLGFIYPFIFSNF